MKPGRSAAQKNFNLGITGLAATARGMLPGCLYAAFVSQPQAAGSCLVQTVAEALHGGRRVLAVLNSPADGFLSRLTSRGIDTHAVTRDNRLLVLQSRGGYADKLARHGAQHFVDELDYFGARQHCLVVVESAEQLFSPGDAHAAQDQARTYQRWFQEAQATGLLLFQTPAPAGMASAITQVIDDFCAGQAFFHSEGRHLLWRVEHWRSPLGAISRREYNIGIDERGELFCANSAELTMTSGRIVQAPDQDRVIVVRAAIQGDSGVPPDWRCVENPAAMLEAATGAVAATCVLAFHDRDPLHVLARTVYQLRRNCGRGLLIIVRERSRHLRYHDELLLMRLGANAVAYAEVGFSRFMSMVESLRGQAYSGDIPDDFESAVRGALPPPHQGYLAAPTFCSMVRDSLVQNARLGIESTLLRLYLLPEVSHLDALRACHANRPGDLFTSDGESLWLFFYACRKPDVDISLARVCSRPLDQVFEGHVGYFEPTDILGAVSEIESRLEVSAVADFTDQLEPPVSPDVSAAPAESIEVADAIRHSLPLGRLARDSISIKRSVERRQLPLREMPS